MHAPDEVDQLLELHPAPPPIENRAAEIFGPAILWRSLAFTAAVAATCAIFLGLIILVVLGLGTGWG